MVKNTKSYELSLMEDLKDPEFLVDYLNLALKSEHKDVLLLSLRQAIKALGGFQNLSNQMERNRTQLYRTLSKNGNPRLDTLLKVVASLGLELSFKFPDDTVYITENKNSEGYAGGKIIPLSDGTPTSFQKLNSHAYTGSQSSGGVYMEERRVG